MSDMPDFAIRFLGAEELEQARPLWLELLDHHIEVSPGQLPEPVEPELSWLDDASTTSGWPIPSPSPCWPGKATNGSAMRS